MCPTSRLCLLILACLGLGGCAQVQPLQNSPLYPDSITIGTQVAERLEFRSYGASMSWKLRPRQVINVDYLQLHRENPCPPSPRRSQGQSPRRPLP